MSAGLQQALGRLAALPGVRAALAATASDGMPAATVAAVDVDADALAAFATALFQRTRLANSAAGYGDTHHLALDAEHGRLFVAMQDDLAIIVLAEPTAAAGLVRVALQRAVREAA
ncbi:MAG TPA: roadblock/LC7 domain-containing protein [Gemmatimonadaceae bacterium]